MASSTAAAMRIGGSAWSMKAEAGDYARALRPADLTPPKASELEPPGSSEPFRSKPSDTSRVRRRGAHRHRRARWCEARLPPEGLGAHLRRQATRPSDGR